MLLRTPLIWGSVELSWRYFRFLLPTKNLVLSCLWAWVVPCVVVFQFGFIVVCCDIVFICAWRHYRSPNLGSLGALSYRFSLSAFTRFLFG
jgi:hypothetical protein